MSREAVRILIAEDNPADVLMVRTALAQTDLRFELNVCSDGIQAMEFVDRLEMKDSRVTCPDLMLLDLNLPCYSGEEVLVRVRQSSVCRNIPVMVFTSSNSPEDRERVTRLGIVDYFKKPADYDEYLRIGDLIKGVLDMNRALT